VFSKLLTWLVVIFIIMWIVTNPGAAGDSVHHWITGALTFMQHVG
jgi:hypothetical protein